MHETRTILISKHINPFMPSVLSYHNFWIGLFPTKRVSEYFLLLPCVIEKPLLNANRADSDYTPYSAASDLGLHSLQMFILWDVRNKWGKTDLCSKTCC